MSEINAQDIIDARALVAQIRTTIPVDKKMSHAQAFNASNALSLITQALSDAHKFWR